MNRKICHNVQWCLLLPQQARSAAVGIDHADVAEFWQQIGGGAGVYMQRMHSHVSLAEHSCNLSGLQQANSMELTVRTLRVLCRLCTAECGPAMHDESHHVFVVETTRHIVPAAAGTGSLLGSIFSMNIPAHAVKTCGRRCIRRLSPVQ
jgi:hypothetical protein